MRRFLGGLNEATTLIAIIGGAAASLLSRPLHAQRPAKPFRLGVILFSTPQADPSNEAFLRGMSDLGYVEGQNIAFEYRFAEGKPERLPELAADLVRHNPDLYLRPAGTWPRWSARRPQFPSLLRLAPIPYGADWWPAWPGRRQCDRESPSCRMNSLQNDWSCSRRPLRTYPGWRCCSIPTMPTTNCGRWSAPRESQRKTPPLRDAAVERSRRALSTALRAGIDGLTWYRRGKL